MGACSRLIKVLVFTIATIGSAWAGELPPLVDKLESPNFPTHVDQVTDLLNAQDPFTTAFDLGDGLFNSPFNALDGVGARVGNGQRFTRLPRADLDGPAQWKNHIPARPTGPNGEACNACHRTPVDDGAGDAALNVIRDPFQTGNPSDMINRNTPIVLATGALQKTAEEMTEELHAIRDDAQAKACATGRKQIVKLETKGVRFGRLVAKCGHVDTRFVRGVDDDLVIKPFQWKGSDINLRDFTRVAAHREIGMQATELVGKDVDGDYDGVINELSVGDITAMVIYNAAQARPVTKLELDDLGLLEAAGFDPLTRAESNAITRGRNKFEQVGCARCHTPSMVIKDPVFYEPSQNANYRDSVFPGGGDPVSQGLDPDNPIWFDLVTDVPDNQLMVNGDVVYLGGLRTDLDGNVIIEHFSDFKRHFMGYRLAERIDEVGTGKATWLTKELWGVGSTAPYLHDGRATTITEAIVAHGGEARKSRRQFRALPEGDQRDIIVFLENLVIVLFEEDDG